MDQVSYVCAVQMDIYFVWGLAHWVAEMVCLVVWVVVMSVWANLSWVFLLYFVDYLFFLFL